jgi:hypothetical protein
MSDQPTASDAPNGILTTGHAGSGTPADWASPTSTAAPAVAWFSALR